MVYARAYTHTNMGEKALSTKQHRNTHTHGRYSEQKWLINFENEINDSIFGYLYISHLQFLFAESMHSIFQSRKMFCLICDRDFLSFTKHDQTLSAKSIVEQLWLFQSHFFVEKSVVHSRFAGGTRVCAFVFI